MKADKRVNNVINSLDSNLWPLATVKLNLATNNHLVRAAGVIT